tara:strand:- start:5659 stop:6006 length:348 start_codon:yes stop_codon:yes gene_type:complete
MTDIYYNPLGKIYTTQTRPADVGGLKNTGYIDDFNTISYKTTTDNSEIVGVNNNDQIYSGNIIKKMRNTNVTIDSMLDDSRIQNKSANLQLSILSGITGISIIVFMLLLKNINTK